MIQLGLWIIPRIVKDKFSNETSRETLMTIKCK
jgi:hypothetical protein